MEKCPICKKEVSNWQRATNGVLVIFGKLCHKSCLYGLTLEEIEWKVSK